MAFPDLTQKQLEEDDEIVFGPNPHANGTDFYGRYQHLSNAKTIREARTLGATEEVLSFCIENGHVTKRQPIGDIVRNRKLGRGASDPMNPTTPASQRQKVDLNEKEVQTDEENGHAKINERKDGNYGRY